jgi:error-prone DNA polymerase
MVAVINNFGGFYTTWVYVKEAVKAGARLHLPCINRSECLTTIDGDDIYLGFKHIQNLEAELCRHIEQERKMFGVYCNMADFVKRTNIAREQLFILIRLGALRDFGNKKELLWEGTLHISKESRNRHQKNTHLLFDLPVKSFTLPLLLEDPVEDAYDEIELLGFPVTMTEFELLQSSYRGDIKAGDLAGHEGKKVRMAGNLVATKDVRTKNGKQMKFGTFLDDRSGFFDTVHFTGSLEKFPFTGRGVYLMEGKVVCDFGVAALEVEKLARLPYQADPRS